MKTNYINLLILFLTMVQLTACTPYAMTGSMAGSLVSAAFLPNLSEPLEADENYQQIKASITEVCPCNRNHDHQQVWHSDFDYIDCVKRVIDEHYSDKEMNKDIREQILRESYIAACTDD